MQKSATVVLGLVAMVAIIVALDVLLFRHQPWPRLMVNVGVVLVFAGFYFRFRTRL
jgi:hypothetical protein